MEQELDLIVPPALRAFYRLHNGTGPADDFVWPYEGATAYLLPDGYGLCPVSRLARWRQDEPFFEEPEPHHRSLIFGGTDPDGVTGIYADCTPGADFGAVGLFEEASHLTENIWPSFSDYLREVADVLDGERRFDPKVGGERTYRPEVNGGVLAWTWR